MHKKDTVTKPLAENTVDTSVEHVKDKFVSLYKMYFQPLYRTAFEMLKDHAASEDIVHETFLRLIDNIDKVDEQESMKTWNYLATIVRHLCIDSIRKQKKTILHDMEADDVWTVSDDDIEATFIGKGMTELVKKTDPADGLPLQTGSTAAIL